MSKAASVTLPSAEFLLKSLVYLSGIQTHALLKYAHKIDVHAEYTAVNTGTNFSFKVILVHFFSDSTSKKR